MSAFGRFPEYWLSVVAYSTLKNSSFMFCQNLIETLHVPVAIYVFLTGNLTQNVYNGKFFNVNNDVNVTNVRN